MKILVMGSAPVNAFTVAVALSFFDSGARLLWCTIREQQDCSFGSPDVVLSTTNLPLFNANMELRKGIGPSRLQSGRVQHSLGLENGASVSAANPNNRWFEFLCWPPRGKRLPFVPSIRGVPHVERHEPRSISHVS